MLKMKLERAEDATKAEVGDSTLLPMELTHVPGLVDKHTAYTESISRYPNRRTAFVGALAMVAFAAGRRYRTRDNTRTNAYFVCYANSGAGKDAPRKVNKDIAIKCGAAANIGDSVGSGEGLQDILLKKSKFLLQNDEFDTLIRSISEDKSGGKESLVRELLTEFSSSGSMITPRVLASKPGEQRSGYCINPHFCFFGSSVGQYLFESLTDRVLENGLVARCLLVDCGKRQPRQSATWREVPDDIVTAYREIFGSSCENGKYAIMDDPGKKSLMTIMQYTPEADALNEEVLDRMDESYDRLNDGQHAGEQSFRARSGELMTKMAMLYAISENHADPIITVDAIKWAEAFVTWCQDTTIANVAAYTAANPHEANAKRIMRLFSKRPSLTKREITKNLRIPVNEANEVIEYLITTGEIIAKNGSSEDSWKDPTSVFHAAK